MTEDDDGFIPGFARKNKGTAEAKTVTAGVQKATTEMFEPKDEQPPAAQPAKKKVIAIKRDSSGLQMQRYLKAKAALERWQRKQNIAARRVAKYAAQVKRYEKKGVS